MEKLMLVVMLPTEKATRLWINGKRQLNYGAEAMASTNNIGQHLHIISDEEPKEGDIAILDWEGKLNPDDMRIGTVEKASPNFEIRNQYGNLSIPPKDGRFENNKRYKVVATIDKSLKIIIGDSGWKSADEGGWNEYKPEYKFLPPLPESFVKEFIDAFNSGKPIKEVLVEIGFNKINIRAKN